MSITPASAITGATVAWTKGSHTYRVDDVRNDGGDRLMAVDNAHRGDGTLLERRSRKGFSTDTQLRSGFYDSIAKLSAQAQPDSSPDIFRAPADGNYKIFFSTNKVDDVFDIQSLQGRVAGAPQGVRDAITNSSRILDNVSRPTAGVLGSIENSAIDAVHSLLH